MVEKRRFSPPITGGSSLLVIFAVLCLTIFALLGLSTVQADSRLSDAAAAAVSNYYAADSRAEAIFAQLRSGETVEGVTVSGSYYFYECPISDTQTLQVQLLEQDGTWSIECWQAVSTAQWEADDALSIWDGTSMP